MHEWLGFCLVHVAQHCNLPGCRYKDPKGMLKLSAKQKQHFTEWVRAGDLAAECSMTKSVSSKNIRQTVSA